MSSNQSLQKNIMKNQTIIVHLLIQIRYIFKVNEGVHLTY